jgi:hypothetical protein
LIAARSCHWRIPITESARFSQSAPCGGARSGLKMARGRLATPSLYGPSRPCFSRALGSCAGPSLLPPLVFGRARGLDSVSCAAPRAITLLKCRTGAGGEERVLLCWPSLTTRKKSSLSTVLRGLRWHCLPTVHTSVRLGFGQLIHTRRHVGHPEFIPSPGSP